MPEGKTYIIHVEGFSVLSIAWRIWCIFYQFLNLKMENIV